LRTHECTHLSRHDVSDDIVRNALEGRMIHHHPCHVLLGKIVEIQVAVVVKFLVVVLVVVLATAPAAK
jgi:hypothetical protein